MRKKLFITAIFIFAGVFSVTAQLKEFKFKNFTQEEGLPSNECYFVYCDSKNFIWMATETGVVRFDGNKLEHFDLPDNIVFKIREDKKGRIWFFSQSGKFAYFFKEHIYAYKYNDIIAPHLKDILITNAYVNDNDEVIINSAGLWNYRISKSGTIERIEYLYKKISDRSIINITQIDSTDVFARFQLLNEWNSSLQININENGRRLTYNVPFEKGAYQQYGCIKHTDYFLYIGKTLLRLSSDGSFKLRKFDTEILCAKSIGNHIWIGLMKGGAVLIDKNLDNIDYQTVLGNLSISGITNDYEGGIWFSSLEKGVFYLKNTNIYILNADSSLSQPIYRINNQDDTAFFYANKHGIYKFSRGKASAYYELENNGVYDLFHDNKRNLFFAIKSFFKDSTLTLMNFRKFKKDFFKNLIVIQSTSEVVKLPFDKYIFSQGNILVKLDLSKISPDELSNNIYFGSDTTSRLITHTQDVESNLYNHQSSSGYMNKIPISRQANLFFSDPGNEMRQFIPRVLYSDINKQVWVGTRDNLFKLNTGLDKPISFMPSQELFSNGISAINQMKNGIYVIGVRFRGVVLMRESSIIASITEAEGLLSNSIKCLLLSNDHLWVATTKGISVIKFDSFDPLKYSIVNIGKNDGLHNVIIHQLILFQNNILAATNNGIYVIEHSMDFLHRKPKPIPFNINSINYYKGDISNIETLSIPYKNNRLTIRYSAISFNSSDELKYYYRFANKDSAWIATNSTELLIENISPGIYDLQLKACIPNQSRFSDIRKIRIRVEKPFWQKTWVLILTTIISLISLFFLYNLRIRNLKRSESFKASQKSQMLELEQAALRSQMNPHFVFNCLTSIQQLLMSGKTLEANNFLVSFARLIRKTLELSSRAYIKIKEEKEYLEEYLSLEKLRLLDSFEFNIEMNQNIGNIEIPNMMLQPIVENSIRHGVKHLQERKGNINISICKEPAFIICTITDNGVGRNIKAAWDEIFFTDHKSYGMEIVSKRLELLDNGKLQYFLEVHDLINEKDNQPAGTAVVLKLPYKMKDI